MTFSEDFISTIIKFLDPETQETGFFCPHTKEIFTEKSNGKFLVAVSPKEIDFRECMEDFMENEIANEKIENELEAALAHSQPLYSFQNIFYENDTVKKNWDIFKMNWLREQALDFLEDYS